MKITIEIKSGEHGDFVTKDDIQQNINAVRRVCERGEAFPGDLFLLIDTVSILEEIQRQLPERK